MKYTIILLTSLLFADNFVPFNVEAKIKPEDKKRLMMLYSYKYKKDKIEIINNTIYGSIYKKQHNEECHIIAWKTPTTEEDYLICEKDKIKDSDNKAGNQVEEWKYYDHFIQM